MTIFILPSLAAMVRRLGHPLLILTLAVSLRAAVDYSTPYFFTTLAGISSLGSADGTGTAARFHYPRGAAVDPAGNLYIADSYNHTIRKIDATGMVTTFAGLAGLLGDTDGTTQTARFCFPAGIAIDAQGNLYVADAGNSTIRKIGTDGRVTTLAGLAGKTGQEDGTGSAARFYGVSDVVVDANGVLYAADPGNHGIRKITPDGTVTTIAGSWSSYGAYRDGAAKEAFFNRPTGIDLDASGNLYVADRMNRRLRKITPDGVVSTLGAPGDAIGFPEGVAVDSSGIAYITSSGATVSKVAPDGTVAIVAGLANTPDSVDGVGSAARFTRTSGIALSRTGELYVTDDHTVRRILPNGTVTTLAGLGSQNSFGATDGRGAAARFETLSQIAVGPNGDAFVNDRYNNTIRKISPAGEVTTLAGMPGQRGYLDGTGNAARFNGPETVAVDRQGIVYVSDNDYIRKITPAGAVTTLAGPTGAPLYVGSGIAGLAIDATGTIHALRTYDTLLEISPTGTIKSSTLRDSDGGLLFFGGGAPALDAAGNLYLASGDNCIRKVSPNGIVTILAGKPDATIQEGPSSYGQTYPGSTDGPGEDARFYGPEALTLDAAGNIYVADTQNHAIRRITPEGMVSTLAGLTTGGGWSPGAAGSADGIGNQARFYYPSGIAVDSTGNLYVTSGPTVRKGRITVPPRITTQPQGQSVTAGGTAVFSVTATSSLAMAYQWQRNGADLAGATGASLTIAGVQAAKTGSYTVIVSNSDGSITSNAATLTITTVPSSPSTPSSGGGGGGGAPSAWFALALLGLVALRRFLARQPA